MQARMSNPVMILREAMPAMQALDKATQNNGVPAATSGLVQFRASTAAASAWTCTREI